MNRNTIAKAYAELESQGVVQTSAGKGSVVKDTASPYRKDVRLDLLKDDVDTAVVQAHHLQVGKGDFLKLADTRFDAFQRQRDTAPRE